VTVNSAAGLGDSGELSLAGSRVTVGSIARPGAFSGKTGGGVIAPFTGLRSLRLGVTTGAKSLPLAVVGDFAGLDQVINYIPSILPQNLRLFSGVILLYRQDRRHMIVCNQADRVCKPSSTVIQHLLQDLQQAPI
jgi:hypothetical protein